MSIPPNLQKLVITGKNTTDAHPGYSTDARTIEQWANIGIVRKLIAGSNITLTPSDGVDAGNGIEIAASGGGGGGTTYGEFQIGSSPALSQYPNLWITLGAADAAGALLNVGIGGSSVEALSNSGISDHFYTLGSGFFGRFLHGVSTICVMQFPSWDAPGYAGGTGVIGTFYISAMNIAGTQESFWQSNPINLISGGSGTLAAGDFANVGQQGAALALGTDGGGFAGIVSSATDVYLASWQCVIDVPGSTTF